MTARFIPMRISFSPIRSDHVHIYDRVGSALVIDGEIFDFAQLPEGGVLPAGAIASDAVCDDVRCDGGTVYLTLQLAHPADAPEALRFPDSITVTEDGPIRPKGVEI